MNRKKKNSKHKSQTYQLSPQDLEQNIIALFKRQPEERMDVKQVARRLNAGNPYQVIEAILNKLREQHVLGLSRSGKYKLHVKEDPNRPAADSQILVGVVDMTRRGDAYVSSGLQKGKDIFVPAERLKGALNGDTVRVRWKKSGRGRPEGSVVEIVQRKTLRFVGTLQVGKRHAYVQPDDPYLLSDIILDRERLGKAQPGHKVVVAIQQWANDNPERELRGEIVLDLGMSGSNEAEMLGILIQNGFDPAFSDEVEQESREIPEEITQAEIALRRDFRPILTFTIDPEDAKDFDDAISFQILENGNRQIGVHIADVSHYVRPGSAIDREAARRTTSVYLVDRVAPMLPEHLSNGLCSLRPNEDKLTFAAVFEFDPKGKIVSEWFGKTIIRSARRFSYEEVQEILETGKGDHADVLKTVNEHARRLREERFKKGAINFESTEVKFRLDPNGKPLAIVPKIRKEAHFLIEDFMLLANRRVGAYIDTLNRQRSKPVPFVYRVHDLPDMEKVENFTRFASELGYKVTAHSPQQVAAAFAKLQREAEGKPEMDVLQQLGIRTMAKASYSTDNIGHYGLAFETYSHFTSPIRRYADLLAHRILFEVLQQGTRFPDKDGLEAQCRHISTMERRAMEAERESVKYKQAEYMQDHVGDRFVGVISGITERGVFVEIVENYCEGMVSFDNMYANFDLVAGNMYIRSGKRQYKMGDTVWVEILSANPLKRRIEMRLLDETKMPPPGEKPAEQPSAVANKKTKQAKAQEQPQTETETQPEAKAPKIPKAQEPTPEELPKAPRGWATLLATAQKAYKMSMAARAFPETQPPFTLLETAPRTGGVLVVSLCATQGKAEYQDLPPASGLEEATLPALRSMADELNRHAEVWGGAANAVSAPYCAFAYPEQKTPPAAELLAARPLFDRLLHFLKPTRLVVFSSQLRDFWLAHDMLEQWEERSYEMGKRKITIGKGIFRYDQTTLPAVVLPHPNARIDKALRAEIWRDLLATTKGD